MVEVSYQMVNAICIVDGDVILEHTDGRDYHLYPVNSSYSHLLEDIRAYLTFRNGQVSFTHYRDWRSILNNIDEEFINVIGRAIQNGYLLVSEI